jgi:hypothetical protein
MAASKIKSGGAARHQAARPQSHSHRAGKRALEPKQPRHLHGEETTQTPKDAPAPRVKPGGEERGSSLMGEAGERKPTRGSRWERADDDTIITRSDQSGSGAAPLADSDEAPEGSER